MSRPRLVIGTFGDITVRIMPSGQFMARAMYRDWDGQGRQVQATGNTAKAAERALKGKLSERNLLQPCGRPGLMPRSCAPTGKKLKG